MMSKSTHTNPIAFCVLDFLGFLARVEEEESCRRGVWYRRLVTAVPLFVYGLVGQLLLNCCQRWRCVILFVLSSVCHPWSVGSQLRPAQDLFIQIGDGCWLGQQKSASHDIYI